METQSLINVLFGVIAFLGGWVVRNLQESMANLRASDVELTKKVQEMEVLVAGKYVTWDGLKDVLAPMVATLGRIEQKLDSKMDKSECEAHHK